VFIPTTCPPQFTRLWRGEFIGGFYRFTKFTRQLFGGFIRSRRGGFFLGVRI
jgi:hypothetical protein